MQPDDLDHLLRAWGAAQNGRITYTANDDRDAPDVHPIARAIPFAPKTRQRAALKLMGRDGGDRRKLMAIRAGGTKVGLRQLPTWAADPIRCKESRLSGPVAAIDAGIPQNLQRVHIAAMELYRTNQRRGLCLRLEYTRAGVQSERADAVAEATGEPLTLRTYRDELRLAREWMRARLAA